MTKILDIYVYIYIEMTKLYLYLFHHSIIIYHESDDADYMGKGLKFTVKIF